MLEPIRSTANGVIADVMRFARGVETQLAEAVRPPVGVSGDPATASLRETDAGRRRRIKAILADRRMRAALFPDVDFGDGTWDILLGLYEARLDGRRLSAQNLRTAGRLPAHSALRHIAVMVERGLLVRRPGSDDGPCAPAYLSSDAESAMARYVDGLSATLSGPSGDAGGGQ